MLIICQTPHQLDITAHRETHLKDLEAYAAETTGDRWTAGPLTADCRPDPLNRANLVWTLYPTQPTTPRYTLPAGTYSDFAGSLSASTQPGTTPRQHAASMLQTGASHEKNYQSIY